MENTFLSAQAFGEMSSCQRLSFVMTKTMNARPGGLALNTLLSPLQDGRQVARERGQGLHWPCYWLTGWVGNQEPHIRLSMQGQMLSPQSAQAGADAGTGPFSLTVCFHYTVFHLKFFPVIIVMPCSILCFVPLNLLFLWFLAFILSLFFLVAEMGDPRICPWT